MESKPRLFLFMPYIPYPVDRGTYQRVYNLLIELSKSYAIDLACFQEDASRTMEPFEGVVERSLAIPFKNKDWAKLFPDRLLNPLPATVVHWQDATVLPALKAFVAGQSYAIVEFIDLVLWPYIEALFPEHPYRVMDRSRVDWLFQTEELARLKLSWKERLLRRENLWKVARLERSAYEGLRGMVVCGPDDKAFLQQHLPDTEKVFVLANGYNESYFDQECFPRKLSDVPSILFCGALDYSPNVDAIEWFADYIWPRIYKELPEANWQIVGKSPDARSMRWAQLDGVDLIGEVCDVRPYYQSAWLQVVPLRIGGGTRLKIVESLGMGTPVVSTTLGAQGLDLESGKDLLLADQPDTFAQSVLTLLRDSNLRHSIEINGLHTVQQNYRWSTLGEKLVDYLKGL